MYLTYKAKSLLMTTSKGKILLNDHKAKSFLMTTRKGKVLREDSLAEVRRSTPRIPFMIKQTLILFLDLN